MGRLSVTGASVVPTSSSGPYIRDFGAIDIAHATFVTQEFLLRNSGKDSIEITALPTSCRCTAATIAASGLGVLKDAVTPTSGHPFLLAAGSSATVHISVSLDVAGYAPGSYLKTVTIVTNPLLPDASCPELELRYTIPQAVSLDPVVIDARTLTAGSTGQFAITAHIDRQVVANGPAPALVSSNPDVTVTAESTIKPNAATMVYRVAVSPDTPIGPLTSTLTFAPDPASLSQAKGAATIWSGARALLVGTVIGDVHAEPATVSFGMAPAGTGSPQKEVQLIGKQADLDGATIESADSWIAAELRNTLVSVGTPIGLSARPLTISLAKDAPDGLRSGRVLILLANKQRLQIAVTAYVTR